MYYNRIRVAVWHTGRRSAITGSEERWQGRDMGPEQLRVGPYTVRHCESRTGLGKSWFVCLLVYGARTHNRATTWQNKRNECAPSEDSDHSGHPPSLIRVFAMRSMGSWGPKVFSYGQRRLWSDLADAQADLSLRWSHSHIVGFIMSRLNYKWVLTQISHRAGVGI